MSRSAEPQLSPEIFRTYFQKRVLGMMMEIWSLRGALTKAKQNLVCLKPLGSPQEPGSEKVSHDKKHIVIRVEGREEQKVGAIRRKGEDGSSADAGFGEFEGSARRSSHCIYFMYIPI